MSQDFFTLSSDEMLATVEHLLDRTQADRRATGYLLPLNSVENRVVEMTFEDELRVVAKFYRPQRWSREQLEEEHQFLYALERNEIPVVTPLKLNSGEHSLGQTKSGIFVAVFPKVRGRLRDELDDTSLRTLGRYMGRIHRVAQNLKIHKRLRLNAQTYGYDALKKISANFFETPALQSLYQQSARKLIKVIESKLSGARSQLVHGDCHLGNVLWQNDSPFFLDFDDCCFAPVVQDVWMVVRGRDEEAMEKRRILLEGYEMMNEFPWEQLNLIEALRGLRIIHHSAWIAERWDDPSFPRLFPAFGSNQYWREELQQLDEILEILQTL